MFLCCTTVVDTVVVPIVEVPEHLEGLTPSICFLIANDAPVEAIISEIESSPNCLYEVDMNYQTALMWAVKKEKMKVLLKMFEFRVNINKQDWDGCNALHYAVDTGNARICQLLLSRGADVDARGGFENSTPLHLACKHNMIDIVQLLISCDADREAVDVNSMKAEDYLPEPFDALKECYKEHALSRSTSMSFHEVGSTSNSRQLSKKNTNNTNTNTNNTSSRSFSVTTY